METVALFTIPEAVIKMMGLKAEDWITQDEFGWETYYCFQGNAIANALHSQLISDAQQVDCEYCYYLGGVRADNPLNALHIEDVQFPKEAFYRWWKEDHRGLKMPVWFADLAEAECKQTQTMETEPVETEPQTESSVSDIEIVEGLTVGDLRTYLTEGENEYIPRLLAVLRAKKRMIQERDAKDAQGFKMNWSAKQSLRKFAEGVAEDELKKVGIENVDIDTRAVARILIKELRPTSLGGTY